ncbi:putative bifunctional diguanylate cyclase/phosphodiesterase [Sphingosinicella rhizophila]|uniref:EAL domain-containing protein n=1 Tax=Sphingosinicella rhizophila TaxID=3050082 RepID=A0ABU3Q795_9SPHN|nr:EAL domain-containing protein [Sphingosinicella sp. GR2756]MDT9598858.1 EAL domain-containing protein [Sphingosinicella sp. GR2756]
MLAAAAAAAPGWLLYMLPSLPPGLKAGLVAVAIALTAAALISLHRLLGPLGVAARRLAAHTGRAGTLEPEAGENEIDTILAGISQLTEQAEALQHRWVQRHPLTGLPTREYLLLQIAEDIGRDPRDSLVGTIRFSDYDRLSAFDPASAETALKAFAANLAAAVGKNRPLAHIDRDCFAIWFRDSPAESGRKELQAICYALGGEIEAGDRLIIPDLEVGTGVLGVDGNDPAAVLTRALVSIQRPADATKAAAPGRSVQAARERFSLEQDLRHAIARSQLEMEFQPVVDLARGRLIGAEALLRWHHPQAGLISPGRFVPILEDINLINEIGMWTLNAACREARNWQRRGIGGLRVAVNLSATQLRDPKLESMILRTLERHRLPPEALELELTETAAAEDVDRTQALFVALRAAGISISIDDFGAGYSSLSYLKKLPFDRLKIDREFVLDVHMHKDSQAICRSLIELARGLEIGILAEGVEKSEEVEMLQGFGCAIFQGFHFSRPLGAAEFVRLAVDPAWQARLANPVGRIINDLENRIIA